MSYFVKPICLIFLFFLYFDKIIFVILILITLKDHAKAKYIIIKFSLESNIFIISRILRVIGYPVPAFYRRRLLKPIIICLIRNRMNTGSHSLGVGASYRNQEFLSSYPYDVKLLQFIFLPILSSENSQPFFRKFSSKEKTELVPTKFHYYSFTALLIIAPSIGSLYITFLHNATSNCLAKATIAVLRARPFCSSLEFHFFVK